MGLLAAWITFLLWGLAPLYWIWLRDFGPLETIAHRVVWSAVFLALVFTVRRSWHELQVIRCQPAAWRWGVPATVLLQINWLMFVWTVYHDRVLESSLGYYLCPLAIVALARLVQGEKQTPLAWMGIGCAFGGVGIMVFVTGGVPWAALAIALSWAGYSLCKQRTPLGPARGLFLETAIATPFALGFLLWAHATASAGRPLVDTSSWLWAASTGVITSLPLLLHAFAAKRIRLSSLGLLQYIVPSCHFLLAVLYFGEPFTRAQLTTFAMIWLGLGLYGYSFRRKTSLTADVSN